MSKGTIYLVDDEEYDRILIGKYLTKSGFECEIFNDGADLITAIENTSSVTALIDIEMPGMNGIEVAKYIRNRLETAGKHYNLIGITGHSEQTIIEEIASAGFDDCLLKPFSKNDLVDRIGRYHKPDDHVEFSAQLTTASVVPLIKPDPIDPEEEEFLKSIIQMFVQNTPDSIRQLKISYKNQDWVALRNLAHKIKPQFQYFGIEKAVKALQEIEDIASQQKNTKLLPGLLCSIEQISNIALEHLKKESGIPD